MTRIPNNHEHIEAQQVDEYVREIMQVHGIKKAHKLQHVILQPDDDIIIQVEVHALIPNNLPVMVVNIKPKWEGEQ